MRISAAGISKRRKAQRGLTLVELLIVIAIMGLMAGVVVLTVRPEPPMDRFAGALEREIIALRNEAVIGSAARGLYVDGPNVYVLEANDVGWRVLSTMEIPDGVAIELRLADEFTLPEHRDSFEFPLPDDDEELITPQVTFGSLGEVTPFTLDLITPDQVLTFNVGRFGGMEVTHAR